MGAPLVISILSKCGFVKITKPGDIHRVCDCVCGWVGV